MSQDELEIKFVLFAMLGTDYKCIGQLMVICLAAWVVLMRKKKNEGAVLVVISIIYLAATPQAARGIWLIIIRVYISLVSHVPALRSSVNQSSSISTSLLAETFKSDVSSFKFLYSPKVNIILSWPVKLLLHC